MSKDTISTVVTAVLVGIAFTWGRVSAHQEASTPSVPAAPTLVAPASATWEPMTPPRPGLRCWSSVIGPPASYCEPDPNATHGASQ